MFMHVPPNMCFIFIVVKLMTKMSSCSTSTYIWDMIKDYCNLLLCFTQFAVNYSDTHCGYKQMYPTLFRYSVE